jgi:D-alanyl-D-alanine carboxypeptidase
VAGSPVSRQVIRRRRTFVGVVGALILALLGFLLFGPHPTDAPTALAGDRGAQTHSSPPSTSTLARVRTPPAYLAWMSGGFPGDFRARVRTLEGVQRSVVVAGDTRWMTASHDAAGAVVDQPASPFAIPIDAFSVNPVEYKPFLPETLASPIVTALNKGEAVLGARSAELRQIGPGGTMTFADGQTITVGYVAPDEVVGWSEMLVSRDVGVTLGISDDRYLLAEMDGHPSDDAFETDIDTLLPAGTLLRVAAPRETHFVRVASGVDPPIVMKEVFGEFAASPHADDPAQLTMDPAWSGAHIETRTVPLLGRVTCNKALFPMLVAALNDVASAGLSSLIHTNSGCYNPRTVARSPTAPPSQHAYGAAIDINAPENPYGSTPTMDLRIVQIFEDHGFIWGGRFLIPDGMHFEYGTPVPAG